MSTETIKQALEERDQALEAKFSEMAEQNEDLKKKNLELSDRLVHLEDGRVGRDEWVRHPPNGDGSRPDRADPEHEGGVS